MHVKNNFFCSWRAKIKNKCVKICVSIFWKFTLNPFYTEHCQITIMYILVIQRKYFKLCFDFYMDIQFFYEPSILVWIIDKLFPSRIKFIPIDPVGRQAEYNCPRPPTLIIFAIPPIETWVMCVNGKVIKIGLKAVRPIHKRGEVGH